MEKKCSTCGTPKPLDQFPPDKRRKDGRKARCRKCCSDEDSQYNDQYTDQRREGFRSYYERLKARVILKLGGKCPCGFADLRALHVDHINDDGSSDRKRFTSKVAYWLHVLQSSDGVYQLLCANCNAIKEWERRHADRK